MIDSDIKVFSGSANIKLAQDIAQYLHIPLGEIELKRFADGESQVSILESVRQIHTYVIQPLSPPANEHLMELLIMLDALKRASALEITVVMPYYGYARQDRKSGSREPITAKLVADLLKAAGAKRLIAFDLHAPQIQGFFDVPVDHLFARPIFISDIANNFCQTDSLVLVSPDVGGVERARSYAKRLNCSLAIIDKRRPKPNEAQAMNVIGEVKDKEAIIIDDMIDTGGTLVKACEALLKEGALSVRAYATHGILSPPAIDRIQNSDLKEVVISDSIPLRSEAKLCNKIRAISCAGLFAEAIKRVHIGQSISSLFM